MPVWCAADKSMLALVKRANQDPRTLGPLYYASWEELRQATFEEAIVLILIFLEQTLGAVPGLSKNLLHSLIGGFLKELPPTYGGSVVNCLA